MAKRATYCKVLELCAKTAEPIEMPSGMLSGVGPSKHVKTDDQIYPMRKGNFRRKEAAQSKV